jgi:hypothetical protein
MTTKLHPNTLRTWIALELVPLAFTPGIFDSRSPGRLGMDAFLEDRGYRIYSNGEDRALSMG